MKQRNYIFYTLEDFILDESFQNYVYKRNLESIHFWEKWLINHPEKAEEANEAERYLKSLINEKELPSAEIKYSELKRLISEINLIEKKSFSLRFKPYLIAATIAGFVFFVSLAYMLIGTTSFKTITHHTEYGTIEKIVLPDNSEVVLNANSTLKYSRIWKYRKIREVWLDGEAFFEVKKSKSGDDKFIVHSGNLDVEVLGTSFNVSRRKGETVVVLNTGKIKLNINEQATKQDMLMVPGEMVKYSEKGKILRRENVRPEKFYSWKEGQIIFDNTCMEEVVSVLENNYGKKVIVKDSNILKRKITGDFPIENLDFILTSISKTLNIKIINHENIITITNTTQNKN